MLLLMILCCLHHNDGMDARDASSGMPAVSCMYVWHAKCFGPFCSRGTRGLMVWKRAVMGWYGT